MGHNTVSTAVIAVPDKPTSTASYVLPKYVSAVKMPGAGVRALARDVFFYDLRDPFTILGGLALTPGITNINFYSMVEIVLAISGIFSRLTMAARSLETHSFSSLETISSSLTGH